MTHRQTNGQQNWQWKSDLITDSYASTLPTEGKIAASTNSSQTKKKKLHRHKCTVGSTIPCRTWQQQTQSTWVPSGCYCRGRAVAVSVASTAAHSSPQHPPSLYWLAEFTLYMIHYREIYCSVYFMWCRSNYAKLCHLILSLFRYGDLWFIACIVMCFFSLIWLIRH